jgi:hypothetical protein
MVLNGVYLALNLVALISRNADLLAGVFQISAAILDSLFVLLA